VVILDSFGRPLAKPQPDADDPLGAAQLDKQQRLERDLSTKVIALLEPVVGAERVRVNVALELNPRTSEETEERYDPNTVIRSTQKTSDVANTPGAIGAVAGVRSNLPPQPADPKTPQVTVPGAGTARTSETTNYEVSKTTRRVLQPPGDVARLSVAVILDDDHVQKKGQDGTVSTVRQARKPEEIQKIHGLVAAAVGLDMERGDLLTVENVAFDEPEAEQEAPPSIFVRYAPQINEFGRLVTVLIVGLVGFFFVLRPLLKAGGFGAKPVEPQAQLVEVQRPRTVADLESEIEAQMDQQAAEKAGENRRLPVLTRRVSKFTEKEPDQVAKLLRGWIHEAER
jgi:flagellar M-ring protein FliF